MNKNIDMTRFLAYIPDENERCVLIEKFYTKTKVTLWTKNCVICLSSNVLIYTGHVHRNTITIIAGFCHKHSNHRYPSAFLLKQKCSGCFGAYNYRMGIKE